MKKLLSGILAAAATVCGICASGLSSSAATIEEVAETARRYGIPETMIQQGFNEYYADPDSYDSETLDYAIIHIEEYYQEIIDRFSDYDQPSDTTQPNTDASSGNNNSADNNSTDTEGGNTTGSNIQDKTESSGNAASGQDTSGSPSGNEASGSKNEETINNNSGGRISKEDFIKMTLEEKQAYVASLPEAEREEFMRTLSAEELKSIVKQLPTDDKAAIVDKFVQAGDAMGVKVTVNEITDDNVSMALRDKNGQLIDVAAVGVIVEDTGYDYTLLYTISGVCVIIAAAGLWLIIRRSFGGQKTEEENGK